MEARLELHQISKCFGATQALRDVTLTLQPGESLAVVGENGAGKSTLMHILSGVVLPDSGTMRLGGVHFAPRHPHQARLAGVAMVHQELALAPHLSVGDNILLGAEVHSWGWLKLREQKHQVHRVLDLLEHPEIHPEKRVAELSPTARQLVELARALLGRPQVIILDEPTSSLTQQDTQRLFAILQRLKSQGVSILYISHFLEEVRQVADRLVVLRNGQLVAQGKVEETTNEQIIEKMIGRSVGELYPRVPHPLQGARLEMRSSAGALTVQSGEILGIFGLVGAGRTELLREMLGLDPALWNTLLWRGRSLLKLDGHARLRQGLGLLSEDRKQEGLMLQKSLEENLTLSELRPYVRFGWLSWARRRQAAAEWLGKLQVKHQHPAQKAHTLSGGNQQKLALARLFHQQAELLLLDEPTKGVDIGSKQFIYRLIGEQAARGKTVILVSGYLPEIFGICDSVAVMVRGRLSHKMRIQNTTEQQVMALATSTNLETHPCVDSPPG